MNQKEALAAQKENGKREKGKGIGRGVASLAALEIGGQQNESARRKLKWSMLLQEAKRKRREM